MAVLSVYTIHRDISFSKHQDFLISRPFLITYIPVQWNPLISQSQPISLIDRGCSRHEQNQNS